MALCACEGRLSYFSRSLDNDGTLYILMVSTSQKMLEEIARNLYITREVQRDKRNYNLKVHTCKALIDVVELMPPKFYVDFIIFILDADIGNCLAEVENNLTLLDSNFTREKICLVNPNPSYVKAMVTPQEIWEFARHYQFNLINGNIKEKNDIFNLTKRILNIAEGCCGLVNGIPMISTV